MSTSRGKSWTIDISVSTTVALAGIEAMVGGKEMLSGCDIPAAFTGTAVSFVVSDTLAGTYGVLTWNGVPVSFAAAADLKMNWHPLLFAGRRFVKIVSNDTEAADRIIIPRFREYQ